MFIPIVASSLFALATGAPWYQASKPLPDYVLLVPGFVLSTGGGQVYVERGKEPFDYKPGPANPTVRVFAEGHTWLLTAKMTPPPATRMDQAAFDAVERPLLVAQHWTILQEMPWIIAKREQAGVTSWLHLEGGSDFLRISVVEQSTPGRGIFLSAPGTEPEPLTGGSEPIYLSHFPGSVLKTSQVLADGVIEITVPGEESHWVGRPLWQATYTGPADLSPFEFNEVYASALGQAGWKIVKNSGGTSSGDATLSSHYARGGRDLWLTFHVTNQGYTVGLADPGAQAEARRLREELDRNGHVALYGIYFDTDSATIKPESEATLSQIVKLLGADASLKLGIEGHTDNTGARPHNQSLSEERAASVKAYLVGHGIAASRLTTAGFADTKPVADNGSPEGRARNRRVELVKR